jgi:exocyst complex component 2
MGGMLQATLEVEFLHQTLGSNVSKTAGDTLQAVYGTIEKAYTGAAGVELELGKVKSLLQNGRLSTKYVYACFKSGRKGTVRDASRGSNVRSRSRAASRAE